MTSAVPVGAGVSITKVKLNETNIILGSKVVEIYLTAQEKEKYPSELSPSKIQKSLHSSKKTPWLWLGVGFVISLFIFFYRETNKYNKGVNWRRTKVHKLYKMGAKKATKNNRPFIRWLCWKLIKSGKSNNRPIHHSNPNSPPHQQPNPTPLKFSNLLSITS